MQISVWPLPNNEVLGTDNDSWIVIKEIHLKKILLEAFGDDDKKKILMSVIQEPMIISDILDTCEVAHTSGYRKIRSLIRAGLLVSPDEIMQSGRITKRYRSIIEILKIGIRKNRVIVKVKFSKTPNHNHAKFKDATNAEANKK